MASASAIVVDYIAKNGTFVFTCPPWAADRLRGLPNRKWNPKTKAWSAPAIRVNVMYMESELQAAQWSAAATEKAKEVKTSVAAAIAPALPFPNHYQFKTTPFPKQLTSLERAFGKPQYFFKQGMGVGKSKIFIDLACASRMHPSIEQVLMVCPLGVRKNWVSEIDTHSPLPIDAYLLNTDKPKEFDAWLAKRHDFKWLIVGVESIGQSKKAHEMVLRFVQQSARTMMCVDESHKIKSHNALRSVRCAEIARLAAIRIAMTGTMIAKGLLDIYGQFEYLNPDILGVGDFYAFRNRYAEMGGYDNKELVGYKNVDELMEIIAPFIYQVSKEEALPDLPPKLRTQRYVTLNEDQAKHYRTMAKDKIVISNDNRQLTVKNALGRVLRLQQIAGGFVSFEAAHSTEDKRVVESEPVKGANPKIADLLDFCDDAEGSVIIWCAYRAEIDAVVAALREKYGADDVVEVHGSISEAQRHINVKELFQTKKATKLVANVATGGTGLTMTAAEFEYFYSNTQNSIDREQGEDRAHRNGQKKSVLIVDCIAQIDAGGGRLIDTVDGLVFASLQAKKDLGEFLKGEIDRLADAGVADLSSLFGLS